MVTIDFDKKPVPQSREIGGTHMMCMARMPVGDWGFFTPEDIFEPVTSCSKLFFRILYLVSPLFLLRFSLVSHFSISFVLSLPFLHISIIIFIMPLTEYRNNFLVAHPESIGLLPQRSNQMCCSPSQLNNVSPF